MNVVNRLSGEGHGDLAWFMAWFNGSCIHTKYITNRMVTYLSECRWIVCTKLLTKVQQEAHRL